MTIDLDALEAAVAEGEKKNFFVAPLVKQLIAELREARGERAAVVAYLRTVAPNAPTRRGADELAWCANAIERGAHRREEEP
jgi:hypothetical protein